MCAVCLLTVLCLASCGTNNNESSTDKPSNVVGDVANDVKDGASDITRDIGEGVEDMIPGAERGFQRGASGDEFTSDERNINGK